MSTEAQTLMTKLGFDIGIAGETGFLLTFHDEPSRALTVLIIRIADNLSAHFGALITDLAPAYKTLAIFYDMTHPNTSALHPYLIALSQNVSLELSRAVSRQIDVHAGVFDSTPDSSPEGSPDNSRNSSVDAPLNTTIEGSGITQRALNNVSEQQIALPVYYDSAVAPDLLALATYAGLSIEQLIALHTGTSYTAYANGFAPGFCYLGHVDSALAVPRHASPRAAVAAGSVAIADRQTAVYPRQSPGGWRIIGRCPLPLFDAYEQPPNKINVGDTVRFYAVDRECFLSLGGIL